MVQFTSMVKAVFVAYLHEITRVLVLKDLNDGLAQRKLRFRGGGVLGHLCESSSESRSHLACQRTSDHSR